MQGVPTRLGCYNNYAKHLTEKWCTGGQPKLVCYGGKFKHIMSSSEKFFCGYQIHSTHGKLAGGLNTSPSLVVGTFIMHCAAMEEKGAWSLTGTKKSWLIGMTLRHQLSINYMDASCMVVLASDLSLTSTGTL